jgi:hypothetical protein
MAEELHHDRLFELIADLDAAIMNLRNAVSDGIYALEGRNRILERENRELRGEIERLRNNQWVIGTTGENV